MAKEKKDGTIIVEFTLDEFIDVVASVSTIYIEERAAKEHLKGLGLLQTRLLGIFKKFMDSSEGV